MIKKFDCVEMKNGLQENLYNELNPSDFEDYYNKLNKKIKTSTLYNKMKSRIVQKGTAPLCNANTPN